MKGVPASGLDDAASSQRLKQARERSDGDAAAPVEIELPFDWPRAEQRRFRLGRLPMAELAATDRLIRHSPLLQHASAELIWLAALFVLLHRYSNETKLIVGSPVPSADPEFARVWCVDVDGSKSFLKLLGAVRSGAEANDQAVEFIKAARPGRFHAPLFHAGFVSNVPDSEGLLDPWASYADLTLHHRGENGGSSFELLYNLELFSAATMARLGGHLQEILREAIKCDDHPICRYNLLRTEERRRMLVDWNDTGAQIDEGVFLPDRIAEYAARTPNAPAVIFRGETLTYAQLHSRSNRLANYLASVTGRPSNPIGVCLERSADCIVAQLAILKTGSPAVLMDPAHPSPWLRGLTKTAGACILVSRTTHAEALSSIQVPVVMIDRDGAEIDACSAERPRRELTAEDADILAGTSGSTGEPKVVVSKHRALNNMIHFARAVLGANAQTRATWIAPPSYGYCRVECWCYLAWGGSVFVADAETAASPEAIRKWLLDHSITHASLVTSIAERLWRLPWPRDAALRVMQVAGEPLRDWPPGGLPYEVFNNYGSTETTTAATCPLVATASRLSEAERQQRMPPAGRPVPNARLYVLDAYFNPVPVGVVGQLVIAGMGLARGYTDQTTTESRFVANMIPEETNDVVFLTRDAARVCADGMIEVLGRLDDEVKVLGTRVDIGKLTRWFLAQPGVKDVAIVDREGPDRNRELVAYVVPAPGEAISTRGLRDEARRNLPDHMVPARFFLLSELPLLPNGKLDRNSLRVPPVEPAPREAAIEPRGLIEETLAKSWSRLLRVDNVGIHDSFFDLGGHSLLALEAMREVQHAFKVPVGLPAFKSGPTISQLARAIERQLVEGRTLAPAIEGRSGEPVLVPDPINRFEPFPLTDMQQALRIGRGSAVELGEVGCHGYFEWEAGALDVSALQTAWRHLIDRHDMLRAVFLPDGRQKVLHDVPPYEIEIVDLCGLDRATLGSELSAKRREMSHAVLADDRWPLFRIVAVREAPNQTRILFSIDLLILDAWSYFQILIPELVQLLEHPGRSLAPLRVTFRDYVVALESNLEASVEYRRSRAYWLERLSELPRAPALPRADGERRDRRPRFRSRWQRVDSERWSRLKAQGYRINVTPTVVLMSSFCEVLRTWSTESRFTINCPIFDRKAWHPEIGNVVGDFTNTLLVGVEKVDGTFAERAESIQQRLWQDLEHRHFSGVRVIRELMRLHGGAIGAEMPIVLTSLLDQPLRSHAAALGKEVFAISQTPQVLLDFQIREVDGDLVFNWDALENVLPAGMLDDMFAAYCGLLDTLIDDPQTWDAERFRLVPEAALERRTALGRSREQARWVLDDCLGQRPDWVPGAVHVGASEAEEPDALDIGNGRSMRATGEIGYHRPDGAVEILSRNGHLGEAAKDIRLSKFDSSERAGMAPRTAIERTVAGIICAVMSLPEIGVYDNLFHAGADSLKLTRISSRIYELFGLELPLKTIFEQPTVADISAFVMNEDPRGSVDLANALDALTPDDMERILREIRAAPPSEIVAICKT
jgi:amino acid adenylation domain-containing protein